MMIRHFGNTRGQAIIFVTLSLVVTFGALGLVVDLGWSSWRQESGRAAAQAAVLAGARSARHMLLTCGVTGGVPCQSFTDCPSALTDNTDPIQVACMYAQRNGFTNGGNNGKQTVRIAANLLSNAAPPVAGYHPEYWISAIVSEQNPPTFAAVMGLGGLIPTAQATAGVFVSWGGCVYTLNKTAPASLNMTGTTTVETGCGVFVDSNSSTAITLAGGATIRTTGGTTTEIVGGWNGSGVITPAPRTGVPQIADPFASMNPPAYSGCDQTAINMGSHDTLEISHSSDFNTPYVICGGINLGSQSSLNLAPGLYVVDGGLALGGQASLSGSGVTIYIHSGSVSMAGGSTVHLSPPGSGDWMGILFYQDRSDTQPANLVGGASQALYGVLYFPSAHLTYNGGTSTEATDTTLVSDTLDLVGNTYINNPANTIFSSSSSGVVLIQ